MLQIPHGRWRGLPNQMLDVLLPTIALAELARVRTERFHLLVIPSLAPHPVQTNGQSPAIATLAIFRPRRIIKWKYLLRHSGRLRTVTWAASTIKKRNIELPCLVICPSRRRFPLESSSGTSPR